MSNYTKATDFAAKDALPSGDAAKVIKGAEFEDEFDAIATAVNSKSDTASPTFTGTVTIPTAVVTTFTLGGTTVTSTAAELNILDGVTATAAELNILDGATTTTTEINYLDGVTSNIQTQLNAKGTVSSLTDLSVTATAAELNYVDGVTSNVQTQLDAKVDDSDFTESFVSNGWTELPNGLIIQWGRVNIAGNGSDVSVSFPKAFTTACLQVVATAEDNGTSTSHNISLGETAPTTTTFRLTNGVDFARNFRFIAIGH